MVSTGSTMAQQGRSGVTDGYESCHPVQHDDSEAATVAVISKHINRNELGLRLHHWWDRALAGKNAWLNGVMSDRSWRPLLKRHAAAPPLTQPWTS